MLSGRELKAVLTLKDELSKELKGVQGRIKVFSGEVARLAKIGFFALTGAVTAAALALKNFVQETVRYGVEVDKVSKQTGMAVEDFQRLAYAAEQEHASVESVTKAMPILAKYMEYARQGQVTYRREFDKMGISVTNAEGKLKSTYEVLLEMSDYYSTATNKTQALAIATTLLGRRGAELVPLLRLGRKGIENLGEGAAVMSEKTIAATKIFSDRLRAIQEVVRGVKMRFTEALLPVLDDLAEKLSNIKWDSDAVRTWAQNTALAVVKAGTLIAEFAVTIQATWRNFLAFMGKVATGVTLSVTAINLALGRIDLKTFSTIKESLAEMSDLDKQIKEDFDSQMKAISEWDKKYTKLIREGIQNTTKLKSEIQDTSDAINDAAIKTSAWAEEFGKMKGVIDTWVESVKSVGDTMGKAITDTMDGIASGTAKSFRDMIDTGKNFADSMRMMFRDLMLDILEEIVKSQVKQALASLFVPAGGGGGGFLGGLFSIFSGFFGHSGGLVTKDGIKQIASIPRLHSGGLIGLQNDEVPAILQTGERVLSRKETREYGKGESTVINNHFYIDAVDAPSFIQLCQKFPGGIVNAVDQSMRRNGTLRSTVRSLA